MNCCFLESLNRFRFNFQRNCFFYLVMSVMLDEWELKFRVLFYSGLTLSLHVRCEDKIGARVDVDSLGVIP